MEVCSDILLRLLGPAVDMAVITMDGREGEEMVRKQILLDPNVNKKLRKLSYELGASESHIIRHCLNNYLFSTQMELETLRELERVGASGEVKKVLYDTIRSQTVLYDREGKTYRFDPVELKKWLKTTRDNAFDGKSILAELNHFSWYMGL